MDFKLIGSILLIVGTSIGAGMLALPIATAALGFFGSLMLLLGCWFVVTVGAFLLLEVNLWLPQNSNLISMARSTLGPLGQLVAWITNLLLLYSLLSAYIAGGSDLLHTVLSAQGVNLPHFVFALLFVGLLGFLVYLGVRAVDYVNRGLMLVKFAAYLLLALLLVRFIDSAKLQTGELSYITNDTAIMVTITSFGYAAIVPVLRVYFASNISKLKQAIFIGSLIPLLCYILWDAVIMGVIPFNGPHGLAMMLTSKSSTGDLVSAVTVLVNSSLIAFCVKLFTSICVITSFLGVGLCLADFLADGLSLEKKGTANIFLHLITLLPPLLIVIFFPHVFIKALQYAGACSVILLILLPALMAWRGRYHRHFTARFKVFGGKPLLAILIIFSLLVLIQSIFKIG